MIAQGLMGLLFGKLVYLCMANLTPSPVNREKFMIVAYASNAPPSMIHSRDDEPHILNDEGPIPA